MVKFSGIFLLGLFEFVTAGSAFACTQINFGSGQRSVSVTSGVCQNGSGWCLELNQANSTTKEILVSKTGKACDSTMEETTASYLQNIGNHGEGPLPQVATLYCEPGSSQMRAVLSVVDLNFTAVVGTAESPDRTVGGVYHGNSYTDYPKDPAGDEYPFLAAGYGDTLDSNGNPLWGYMCLYKPGTTQTGQCGANFMQIATTPLGSYLQPNYPMYFREVGGYLEDLDGDGWDDISLIYHSLIYTISGRTGLPLATTVYDIAKSTEPNSFPWFHSGRNYGIHTVVSDQDGVLRTVMVGGVPVGSFSDAFCNVSRFAGMLASSSANPGGQYLAWSHYYGFTDNSYVSTDQQYANNPLVNRLGDMENGCVHIPSDGISSMGATQIIVFNYFYQDAPADQCIKEQFSYYAPGNDGSTWHACLNKNLKSRGVWGVRVLNLSDGATLKGSLQTYIWGMDKNLLPTHEPAYIVQILPVKENFDLSDVPAATAPKVEVRGLSTSGLLTYYGSLPVNGLPKINSVFASGRHGVGSFTTFAELVKRPDPNGLDDFEMRDGTWVGYDLSNQAFVVK